MFQRLWNVLDGWLQWAAVFERRRPVNTLYAISKPQADEREITEEDFGELLVGDTIEQAATALVRGIISFFPNDRRTVLERLWKATSRTRTEAIQLATTKLDSPLAQGDFALAGEIAWASIKLAFAQGIAWVTNAWTEFTTGLSSIWDGMVTYLRQIWNDVVSWLAKSILQLVGSVQSALDAISKYDPTGLADKLKQQMSVDVEGAIRTVEEDRARFNQSQDLAKGQRDDERVRAMQDQLAATEAQLAKLRAAREAALAKSRAAADKAGPAGSPLAKAMDELEKALDDAANAKKRLFDPAAADQQMTGAGDLTSQFASTGSLAGTFSASVAAMLGRSGDDPAERTAEAVESMDGTLTDIRDDLRGRPMLAFDE